MSMFSLKVIKPNVKKDIHENLNLTIILTNLGKNNIYNS